MRDLTAAILSEYEDVLSDELNPVPMQTGTDMHINLVDNVKPFKTLLARRVPLRYETEANKTIQDLIDKKVIVPVSESGVLCAQRRWGTRPPSHRLHQIERLCETTRAPLSLHARHYSIHSSWVQVVCQA